MNSLITMITSDGLIMHSCLKENLLNDNFNYTFFKDIYYSDFFIKYGISLRDDEDFFMALNRIVVITNMIVILDNNFLDDSYQDIKIIGPSVNNITKLQKEAFANIIRSEIDLEKLKYSSFDFVTSYENSTSILFDKFDDYCKVLKLNVRK